LRDRVGSTLGAGASNVRPRKQAPGHVASSDSAAGRASATEECLKGDVVGVAEGQHAAPAQPREATENAGQPRAWS